MARKNKFMLKKEKPQASKEKDKESKKKAAPKAKVSSKATEKTVLSKVQPKGGARPGAKVKQLKPAAKLEKATVKPAAKPPIKAQTTAKDVLKRTATPPPAQKLAPAPVKPEAASPAKPVEKIIKPVVHEKPKPAIPEEAKIIKEEPKQKPATVIELEMPFSVKQLSLKINVKPSDIIASLMQKGVFVNINQSLSDDVVAKLTEHYNFEVKRLQTLEEELTGVDDDGDIKIGLIARSPVVTFMGHVDHGKTSLLDYIRNTKVASKEKGGITQHIGAYRVKLDKGSVTFLDTPGHEAFTSMRARGANATDIVVLVVAANDGVMPQTKEAIDHARAAGVPIVVAINKCDLPDISLDKIKRQLSEQDLMPEDWGGKTIAIPVSAKTGYGVDKLLEMLLLEAEMLELKANPLIRARGVVVEGKLSAGKGAVATLLVKNGTLRVGDTILSGIYYGKIRAMHDDKGNRITEAPPSTPIEVLGLEGVPEAGDEFFVVKDERKAKTLALLKQEEKRHKELRKTQRVSLEHLYEQIKEGQIKELKIILKSDVQGSSEAITKSLEHLSTNEVKLNIVHVGVGNVNESDVMLAVVTNAIIIGFTVKTDPQAEEIAKKENIDIKKYDIIYEAINDVQAAMEGLLEPILKETFQGRAKVQQVFNVSKIGTVAGSIVVKGSVARSNPVRIVRGGAEIFRGKIHSLKRFKDDVRDVQEGIECGISFHNFSDIKVGDLIESYIVEKVARRLEKRP